jgi:tetratricopeptide (TPR) repeat protein
MVVVVGGFMRRFLLVLCLLCSGVAYAQKPTINFPPPPTDENKRADMAEEYFNKAEALYRVQEYEEAYQYYKQSYLLSLQATLLFNMGQCSRQMGKHEEALKSYKSFVRDDPNNKLRSQVEKLIEEEERIIKEEERIRREAKPTVTPPNELDADKDNIPNSEDSCMNDKEDGKGKAPLDGCPDVPAIIDTSKKTTLDPTAKLMYLGAGGGAVVGGVVGVLAFTQANKVKTEQAKPTPNEDVISSAFDKAKAFALISDVFFLAALGAGGAGFLLQQKSKKQPEVTLSIVPNGASVAVRF